MHACVGVGWGVICVLGLGGGEGGRVGGWAGWYLYHKRGGEEEGGRVGTCKGRRERGMYIYGERREKLYIRGTKRFVDFLCVFVCILGGGRMGVGEIDFAAQERPSGHVLKSDFGNLDVLVMGRRRSVD